MAYNIFINGDNGAPGSNGTPGHDGGTGATPLTSQKHAGLPKPPQARSPQARAAPVAHH